MENEEERGSGKRKTVGEEEMGQGGKRWDCGDEREGKASRKAHLSHF